MGASRTTLHDAPQDDRFNVQRTTKILFVCTGNICRSAYAEAYARTMLTTADKFDLSSAGTAALVGHAADPLMAHEARLRGFDTSGHRARQLTGRMLKTADVVLVFGEEHVDWIAAEFPEYRAKVAELGQAARALRSRPKHAASTWDSLVGDVRAMCAVHYEDDEIEDPYRRGPDVAQRVAERICADLGVLFAGVGA